MTALRGRALAEATLAHIEAHPEEWQQEEWRCGSTACFAGWAAVLAGGRWRNEGGLYLTSFEGRPTEPVWRRAEALLGISKVQAARLFSGDNTLPDLRRIVADIWPTGGAQ